MIKPLYTYVERTSLEQLLSNFDTIFIKVSYVTQLNEILTKLKEKQFDTSLTKEEWKWHWNKTSIGQPHSEVLDGKQRLNAVLDYVRGKFDIDGYYFKDLNYNDLQRFYNTKMVYRNIKYYDKQKGWSLMTTQQKVELFLQINEYGQHVSEEHLSKIKEEYLKEN